MSRREKLIDRFVGIPSYFHYAEMIKLLGYFGFQIGFLALIWGVHTIIHFLEEYMFNFDPINGKMKVINEPIRT